MNAQEDYDVNFPRRFQIVQEKRYLEKIRDALPRESGALQRSMLRLANTHILSRAA